MRWVREEGVNLIKSLPVFQVTKEDSNEDSYDWWYGGGGGNIGEWTHHDDHTKMYYAWHDDDMLFILIEI